MAVDVPVAVDVDVDVAVAVDVPVAVDVDVDVDVAVAVDVPVAEAVDVDVDVAVAVDVPVGVAEGGGAVGVLVGFLLAFMSTGKGALPVTWAAVLPAVNCPIRTAANKISVRMGARCPAGRLERSQAAMLRWGRAEFLIGSLLCIHGA